MVQILPWLPTTLWWQHLPTKCSFLSNRLGPYGTSPAIPDCVREGKQVRYRWDMSGRKCPLWWFMEVDYVFLTTLLPTGGLRACECGRNAPQTCGAYCTLGLLGGILFRGNPWVFLWQVQESPAGSQEVADLETTTNSSKIHLWSLLCLDAVFYFHDFWYWCMYLCYTLYMWVDECICLFDTPLSWNTLFLVE